MPVLFLDFLVANKYVKIYNVLTFFSMYVFCVVIFLNAAQNLKLVWRLSELTCFDYDAFASWFLSQRIQ